VDSETHFKISRAYKGQLCPRKDFALRQLFVTLHTYASSQNFSVATNVYHKYIYATANIFTTKIIHITIIYNHSSYCLTTAINIIT